MPKLYEYLGIIILFYANEHEPVHVHGRKAGKESKAEIIVKDGTEYIITVKSVAGKPPLDNNDLKAFKSFVTVYAEKIVQKWIDFFILNKPISPENYQSKGEIMNAVATAYIEITKARYLKDYKIEFNFNDETQTIVDFEPFLKQAKNPMLKKYLDLKQFKNFTVRDGDIDWNDYELCFPIADIYEGNL